MPSPASLPAVPVPTATRPPATREPGPPTVRRWALAVTVYVIAVFNRTSLGVAGLQAARRFSITPAQLSVFVLV